jgi:hypothetical protein
MKALVGDVAIVSNPSIAKIEYLLTNKLIMTNEVAGIKAEDVDFLSQYYLTCGDFSNVYEKRTIANYVGSFHSYNIQKLSNVVCFNNIDCYNERQSEKYFDKLFQKAIRERFLPFKFRGKITESFGAIIGAKATVDANVDYYKNNIKMLKYLEVDFEKEIHGYIKNNKGFVDRALRNWETICLFIDSYASSQQEYDELCDLLFQRYEDYLCMVNGITPSYVSQGAFDKFVVTEVKMNKKPLEKEEIL